MKLIFRLVVVFLVGITIFFSVSVPVYAIGQQSGKVVDVRVSSKDLIFNNSTHFKVEGENIDRPSCVTNPISWALNTDTPTGRSILATLLIAMSTDKKVNIWGNGECTLMPGMEDAHQVAIFGEN